MRAGRRCEQFLAAFDAFIPGTEEEIFKAA
jgi:hypothetical protein